MKKYLVTREITEDYIIPANDEKEALSIFNSIVNYKDSSISDLILQHNIDLHTDILKYKPVEEIKD